MLRDFIECPPSTCGCGDPQDKFIVTSGPDRCEVNLTFEQLQRFAKLQLLLADPDLAKLAAAMLRA